MFLSLQQILANLPKYLSKGPVDSESASSVFTHSLG